VLKVNIDWDRRNRMILQDKVALVTGGTSGIGRATALKG
jgi:FlaA1/EpsC-like NDP-sugar epimerase